ncbi:MAG: NAD(P)/FAD-dependent oxidoreductase [Solirubrobacteraceae bacterium]
MHDELILDLLPGDQPHGRPAHDGAGKPHPRVGRRMSDGMVIVGGGLAAQRAAESLRRDGYEGALRVVAAEAHLPYDRPPLSKAALKDEPLADRLAFREASWYAEQSVDLLLGTAAAGLRPAERRVLLSDGSALRYERLLIATGSRPRRLPTLTGYENVHELRTIDDTRRLAAELQPGARLAVVGAGFVGMEVAATARGLGCEVTLIEAADDPLAALLGAQVGAWFSQVHRNHGVSVLTGRTVERVDGGRRAAGLILSDGTTLPADQVLVGVGVEPDTDWLAGTPLEGPGVRVDLHGRTSLPGVFAAGDAAATFDPLLGRHRPGSHWEAAARQARRAARLMIGLEPGDAEHASFWTDQYGIRIQYLGQARRADRIVIDGEREECDFTVLYRHGDELVAALLVNRSRSLPMIRNQISKGDKPI